MGAEADGEIGDRDPVMAVRDACAAARSTRSSSRRCPGALSRWLGEDVPSRLRDAVRVPVTVVTQEATVA